MKLFGIVFVIFSAGTVGFQMASSLRKSCDDYRALLDSLQLMQHEIEVCRTPLPQVFALMAASSEGALEDIYSEAAHAMSRNCWISPYDAMKSVLQNGEWSQYGEVLLPLCRKLGKYDLDAQLSGIHQAQTQTERMLLEMEKERTVKSKAYRTLGICAGLAAAILLI